MNRPITAAPVVQKTKGVVHTVGAIMSILVGAAVLWAFIGWPKPNDLVTKVEAKEVHDKMDKTELERLQVAKEERQRIERQQSEALKAFKEDFRSMLRSELRRNRDGR